MVCNLFYSSYNLRNYTLYGHKWNLSFNLLKHINLNLRIYLIGDTLKRFLFGILIGIAAILPGLSGGVLLVIFGLYEKITNSILHFFKNIKKNFLFLSPIFLGILLGVFLFSHVLRFSFDKYNVATSYTFIGLILGSLPLVYRESQIKKISIIHILCFLLSFSLSLYLAVLEETNTNFNNMGSASFEYLVLAGTLMSAGIVIPGVSKSVILMILNIYQTYLLAISSLNFTILMPIALGLAIGSIIFLNLINFLFKYLKSYTYFAIMGFILGSSFVLYPRFWS